MKMLRQPQETSTRKGTEPPAKSQHQMWPVCSSVAVRPLDDCSLANIWLQPHGTAQAIIAQKSWNL